MPFVATDPREKREADVGKYLGPKWEGAYAERKKRSTTPTMRV